MISPEDAFEKAAAEATAINQNPAQRITGLAVAAVSTTGDSYMFKSGFTSIGENGEALEAIDENTVLWMASVTKLMTSVAAMQCVERGLISLDENLEPLLPEWKHAVLLSGFEKDGSPILEPLKKRPTLRQLLSHSAGMGYDIKNPLLMRYHKGKPKAFCGRFSEAFAKTPFVYEPGEAWQYSGSLDWVGTLVERVNGGISLGQFMNDNIWQPLKMESTTFHLETRPELEARCAKLTIRDPAAKTLTSRANDMIARPSKDANGGAGAFSTVADIIKLLSALLNSGQGILAPSTVAEMFTSQLTNSNHIRDNLADPNFSMGMTTNLPENTPVSFGIGGMIVQEAINSGRQANSMQWGGLPNISWWIDPKGGVCGIYASQMIPPTDEPSIRIKWLFEKAAYQKLAPGTRR
ncbi:hypothetical protein RBB50_011992 [Rhinocladiella similis]